jgi:hypothetical protein
MKKASLRNPGRRSSAKQAKRQAAAMGARLQMPTPKPVLVRHLNAPPPFKRRENIHPRRILPRVREGREREFHSVTRPTMLLQPITRAFAPHAAAADDLTLATNTELPEPGLQQLASNVGEPSVAVNRDVVLYTGNWYAARSIDGGQTFQYIDPFTAFPDPPNLGFCCDQVANYIASIDTFVWLLQYSPKSGPQADNIQRLAFATTDEVKTGHWRLFDITTKVLGVVGQFLDFPDIAVGANSLYVTTNIFTPGGQSAGAAVVRIPIDSIGRSQVTAQTFVSSTLNSFRVAQNCGSTAFFATHQDTSTLNLFTWDEGQATPISHLVEVARWISGSGFPSRTPDGRSWLDRADPRMTGATLAGTDLYFAWGVNTGSNHRTQPFIQIARIDANDLTLLENINIFDPDSATCYGALSTNADGEVGISYMIGGGPRFPSHVVGILTGNRKDVIAAAGDSGPEPNLTNNAGEWGDYLAVRPIFPDQKLFAAAGYVLKGGANASNRNATPHFLAFGRASNAIATGGLAVGAPGIVAPAPPQPAGRLPPTPPTDGAPISDVNTLSVVSADVAAKIKAAAGFVAGGRAAARVAPELAAPLQPLQDVPGSERWPVKTGQDPDRAKVGKNIVNGTDLGAGIVESTLEELISLPRPPGMEDASRDPPQFMSVRNGITEVTIWRITARIVALKHEKDGDYHLVLQGTSGQQMVAEIPTPTSVFIGDSPWLDNIRQARKEIDDKLVRGLSPASFGMMNDRLVPQGAATSPLRMNPAPSISFVTPPAGSGLIQPLFQTAITPTLARITGVGFFDRAHGATGAAPNVIELHPALKIEWQ